MFLSFGTGGPSALTSNVTLNLDFDEVPPTFGCNDPAADNYDSTATIDDGSCTYPVPGCMDPNALNYPGSTLPGATVPLEDSFGNTTSISQYVFSSWVPCIYPEEFDA